jgi:hypothetical protein
VTGVGGPAALTGKVSVKVNVFLEIALRAGLDLSSLIALTGPQPQSRRSEQQEAATLAALESSAPRALAQQAGAMMSLSPIARRAQAAANLVVPKERAAGTSPVRVPGFGAALSKGKEVKKIETPSPGVPRQVSRAGTAVKGAVGRSVGASETRGTQPEGAWGVPTVPPLRLYREGARTTPAPTFCEAVGRAVGSDPECSTAGGACRATGVESEDALLARQAARREAQMYEEQAVATSKDAELAMLLVAEEAREKGIDRAAALQAQEGGSSGCRMAADKGKNVGAGTEQGAEERAFGWEDRLSRGAWDGAANLAHITLQPGASAVSVASQAHTHALACFADGRPMVSANERAGFEGTPDWVDNSNKALQVMSSHGLVAPARVLVDGGNFYSMAGFSLRSQLGLTSADMDAGGHKVHTATGKVESLLGGPTKNPVPIVLNRGEPSEVTLYECVAFTDSKGYDLLIGTRAAYPCGLSVDRWAERAVYRADWRGKGEVIGHLPMRLHQERQGGWTTVGEKAEGGARPGGSRPGLLLNGMKGGARPGGA